MRRLGLIIVLSILSVNLSAQTQWVKHPDNPLLVAGEPGEWDANLDFIGSVIFYNEMYHMWYTAFDDSKIFHVGHVTSPDGITWTKDSSNPVFGTGAPGSWDQDYITCGDVTMVNDTLHMWYTGYKDSWDNTGIGHAFSTDGITWVRDPSNPVLSIEVEGSWNYSWIWIDEVVFDGMGYHMWYAGGSAAGDSYVGHATSPDGSVWNRDPMNPVLNPGTDEGWDYPRVGFSELVYDDSKFHMWYSGGYNPHIFDIGYASSPDGTNWIKYIGNPVLKKGSDGTWDSKSVWAGCVMDSAGAKYKMWYRGEDDSSSGFGYAESSPIMGVSVMKSKVDHIRLYPNPTNKLITIESVSSDFCSIEITDLNGQFLFSEEMEGTTHQIDLSSLQKGIYFITIRSKDFVATRKIIKL